MLRKGHETRRGLNGTKWSEATLVGSLPGSLEFIARSLPFVKLSLSNLPPALEAAHVSPFLAAFLAPMKMSGFPSPFRIDSIVSISDIPVNPAYIDY
jgi:hypothetical protein